MLVSLGLLLSVATAVKAETWVLPNTSGGEITLTSQACKVDNGRYESLKHAYTWTHEAYVEGCWTVVDGNVHIVWIMSNGTRERRVYSLGSFSKKGSM